MTTDGTRTAASAVRSTRAATPRLASARIRRNQRDIVTSLAQIIKAANPIILRYDLQRRHAMGIVMRKCAEGAIALN